MKVGIVATSHACDQALLRYPDEFPIGTLRGTIRRVLEREVTAALAAGRTGPVLEGYSLDSRRGGQFAWTVSRSRCFVVSRQRGGAGVLTTIVTVLPPADAEVAAA